MKPLERIIVSLDSPPWSAAARVLLGIAIPPAFVALSRGYDRIWFSAALFLALLVLLRVIPAVLRRVLPFSGEAKEIWAERRSVSKQQDSRQWQKLFWIGVGMLLHVLVGDGLRTGEFAVAVLCLTGGGAGLLFGQFAGAAPSAK